MDQPSASSAGGDIDLAGRRKKAGNTEIRPDNESNRMVARDPAEAEVLLRLGALQVENQPPLSPGEEEKESEPKERETKVKNSFGQYLLEMRAKGQVETAKELEAMLKRSRISGRRRIFGCH